MLTAIAFIGLAGAGSAIRFLAADRWPGGHRGTLLVNVAGSLLRGLLRGAGAPVPLVVGVGGLGALTTLSTFASDTLIGSITEMLLPTPLLCTKGATT